MANRSTAPFPTGDSFAQACNALLVTDAASNAVMDALDAAGIRVREMVGAPGAIPLLDAPRLDLIVIDARAIEEAELLPLLDRLAARDMREGPALVVILPEARIDLAGGLLPMPRTELLCDPGATELLAALVVVRTRGMGASLLSWTDVTRDAEIARLRRLNEEVARIADALARLSRGELVEEDEIDRRTGVRTPDIDYRGPDVPVPEIPPSEIRAVIRARRLRGQYFEPELFADPAWDMLLDLFAASLERRRVSVSSLCIAAAVPPTTALRWIGTMHDAGLFGRESDPGDRRRAYIVLTEKALTGMRAYVGAVRRAGLGLV